ncbi:MAG: tetratricopeptide repeat protein [Planctomycetota bacterium]|nr:MAG: tetratricopeptide repeat protein [Planctomycetota bacterium]
MNPSNSHIVSIFADALEFQTEQERQAFIDQACGQDAGLRAQIEGLLQAHVEAGNFLAGRDASPSGAKTTHQPRAAAGETIGPYKLLEEIGEGGMGIVYMADQQSPVRRRVALKIIKPGMDTRQVIARFEAERQALAMMDHPNIAKVLDAGTTPSGGPYFVMELVRGIALTDYCDQNNLSVTERLELFVSVCQAVQHAHQKGVVHRDLKPSNVLVTLHDEAVPKVIDFGVAKAINQQLTEKTLFTNFAQMVGTPLYMSPEQAEMSGLDVDTRSDVYSLGVLLYELLTGTTPFDRVRLREAAYDEIRRIIREEEPPRPSTRISTLGKTRTSMAAHRKADPDRLSRMLRGELDWVVMKTLEKDRTRRYETANGLARDIQRFLEDQPVEACPPSAVYRFRKFSRRNRVALLTAAVVAASLVLGTLVSTWQAVRATRAESLAQDRLIAETKARTEADLARAAEAEQRQLAEAERTKAEAARVKAEDQRAVAEANFQKARQTVDEYFTIVSENKLLNVPGLQPLRKDLLESALRFYETSAVERTDDPAVLADLATTHLRVAVVYHLVDQNTDAIAAVDKALEVIDRLRKEFPEARDERRRLGGFWLGHRRSQQGVDLPADPESALRTLMRLNATWQALAEEFPADASFRSDLAANLYLMGDMLATGGQPSEGIKAWQQAKEILLPLVSEFPENRQFRADLARVHDYLGAHLKQLGRADEAEAECRAGLALREELVAESPDSPQYREQLGKSLRHCLDFVPAADTDQAEKLMRRLVELTESLVQQYPNVALYRQESASSRAAIARILLDRGESAAAVQEAQLAARRAPNDWHKHQLLRDALRALDDAETTLAITRENAILSPDSELAHHYYGLALKDHGRLDEAAKEFARGLEFKPDAPWSHHHLAGIRLEEGRLLEALDAAQSAVRIDPKNYEFHIRVAEVLDKIGDRDKKLEVARANAEAAPDSEPAHHWYGLALREHGRLDEAAREFERGLEINPDTPWSYLNIVEIRHEQNRLSEALDAAEACLRLKPTDSRLLARLVGVVGQISDAGNKEQQQRASAQCDDVLAKLADAKSALDLNNLAWRLVVSEAPSLGAAAAAVQAAERACEIEPTNATYLNTLGAALYRAGEYESAAATLKLARDVDSEWVAPAYDCYLLAMSHAKLGQADVAEKWFHAADRWTALYNADNRELAGFREEAIDVLAIEPAPLKPISVTPAAEQELFELLLKADPDAEWVHHWRAATQPAASADAVSADQSSNP